jgi:hypothetical protein
MCVVTLDRPVESDCTAVDALADKPEIAVLVDADRVTTPVLNDVTAVLVDEAMPIRLELVVLRPLLSDTNEPETDEKPELIEPTVVVSELTEVDKLVKPVLIDPKPVLREPIAPDTTLTELLKDTVAVLEEVDRLAMALLVVLKPVLNKLNAVLVEVDKLPTELLGECQDFCVRGGLYVS